MSVTQMVANKELNHILEDSIGRRTPLLLSHGGSQGWCMYKSQFVAGSQSSQVIEVKRPVPREGSSAQLPETGDTLGVSFRFGHKKCMFGTILKSIQHDTDNGVATLHWPDQIQQLQRRSFQRARPPKDLVIAVRFWREEASSGTAIEARTVYHGQLEDVSAGGMQVRVTNPDRVQAGATYRCAFTPRPGKPSIVLDALVRHHEAFDGCRASVGFQFVGLETAPEGQRNLERLARTVHQFQRARSRNHR